MPCELCKAMPQNIRTIQPHERLRQTGVTQRLSRPGKLKAVWITEYVCDICETRWRHIDDAGKQDVGWTIESVKLSCA